MTLEQPTALHKDLSARVSVTHGEQPAQQQSAKHGEPVIDKSAAIRIATTLGWGPKREWVGLTDEEVIQALNGISFNALTGFNIAKAIEALLKEKNCG